MILGSQESELNLHRLASQKEKDMTHQNITIPDFMKTFQRKVMLVLQMISLAN